MSFDNNQNEQQLSLENRQDDNKLQTKQEELPRPEINKNQPSEENKQQAERFSKYIDDNGIGKAFQIIFAEILSKKVKEDTIYAYTAMRLRQIGTDVALIKEKQSKK